MVCRDFVSEQIVIAGNGTCQTGVGLLAKLTNTGEASHFIQVWIMRSIQKYRDIQNKTNHHNLKKMYYINAANENSCYLLKLLGPIFNKWWNK